MVNGFCSMNGVCADPLWRDRCPPGVAARISRRHAGVWIIGFLVAVPWAPDKAGATVLGNAEVLIQDYKFTPATLSVKVGTRVRWTNMERRTTHSVLFTGPQGFESERFFPGESWERVFDKPGLYPYVCGPHPEMKGLVEVLP